MALQGERLRALREARGYTREQLAEKLDVGPPQIWRWETGENDPKGDFVARLASLLNTTTDYLLGREDHPTERYQERDLSPDEMKLVEAFRTGRLRELIRLIDQLFPDDVNEESDVSGSEPAIER